MTTWFKIHVIHRGDHAARFPDMPRKVMNKADITSPGEKHPKRWAFVALDNDPAMWLAFWVLL